jgi:hypothetical protein
MVLGVIVIIAGLLGLLGLGLVGDGALFVTNSALDVVYIVIGLVLLGVGIWAPMQSMMWLKVAGVIYVILALLGFLMASPLLGLFAVASATTWLHLVLGLVMLAAGFWGKEDMPMSAPAMM